MAALQEERSTPSWDSRSTKRTLPVAATTIIYAGSIVCDNGSGYAVPGSTATTLIAVGRAQTTVDNSAGSAGDINVDIDVGTFRWANGSSLTIADRYSLVYVDDDQTVHGTSTGRSIAGTLMDVDTLGAWVDMGPRGPIDSSAVTAVSNSLDAFKTDSIYPVTLPVALSLITGSDINVARFTPGFDGTITKISASASAAVTSASKTATLYAAISGTRTGGGACSLISATLNSMGAKTDGSAVTSANTFTSTQELTVVSSGVAQFLEGAVITYLFLKPTG